MILLDAMYINNSGGKILLDYLIEQLEIRNCSVYYLLDDRIKGNHSEIMKNRVTYLKASIIKRHIFYRENKELFSKVLCFGNLPPFSRLNIEVYTF